MGYPLTQILTAKLVTLCHHFAHNVYAYSVQAQNQFTHMDIPTYPHLTEHAP